MKYQCFQSGQIFNPHTIVSAIARRLTPSWWRALCTMLHLRLDPLTKKLNGKALVIAYLLESFMHNVTECNSLIDRSIGRKLIPLNFNFFLVLRSFSERVPKVYIFTSCHVTVFITPYIHALWSAAKGLRLITLIVTLSMFYGNVHVFIYVLLYVGNMSKVFRDRISEHFEEVFPLYCAHNNACICSHTALLKR